MRTEAAASFNNRHSSRVNPRGEESWHCEMQVPGQRRHDVDFEKRAARYLARLRHAGPSNQETARAARLH